MKKFKIQIPASQFYFHLFLFPTIKELKEFLIKKEGHHPPDDFYGLVSRYFEGKKIAHLYFSAREVNGLIIEHELTHILWQYMRCRYFIDKNYNPFANHYEEEIAYLNNYLGVKIKYLINFNNEASVYLDWVNHAKEIYDFNRKNYKWGEVKRKKKGGRKVSA